MTDQAIQGYPMSLQQNRAWSLKEAGSSYCTQCALLLEGEVDPEAVRTAVQALVDRYEICRTTFRRASGLRFPLQVVADSVRAAWSCSDAVDGAVETRVAEVMEIERALELDLDSDAAFRFHMIRGDGRRHALVITASPLVADAATLRHLGREVAETMSGGGEPSAEPFHYVDFAAWQGELREEENATIARRFWEGKAVAEVAHLSHPLARDGDGRFRTERHSVALDSDLSVALREWASSNGATSAQAYLAAWRLLLARTTDSEDLVVAYGSDGRTDEELEGAIGPFGAYLPLRLTLPGGATLEEATAAVGVELAKARDWLPYFGWDDLGLGDGGEPGYLAFGFDFREERPHDGAPSLSVLDAHDCVDRFDLRLACRELPDGVVLDLYHDAERLDHADVERLGDQFVTLLEGLAAAPSKPAAAIALPVGDDIDSGWGPTDSPPTDAVVCAHHLVETHAEAHPDRTALRFEQDVVTYGELDRTSAALAARLMESGVGPGDAVGICASRSAEVVVAMFAALKCGAAYVPIDASLPAKRIEGQLSEAGVRALVGHRSTVDGISVTGAETVLLEELGELEAPPGHLRGRGSADAAAYVIFTSGTTGRPKGVVVEHRQLAAYARAVRERLDLPDGSTFATVSSFSADLGNTAVFGALCTGGCLHVVSDRRRTDPTAFAEYFAAHRVDCLKVVPSHLEALLTVEDPARAVPLRTLVVGGEATRWELVDRIRDLAPGCALVNHYGPTETTVGATTLRFESRDPHSATLPLGSPLPGYRAVVMDRYLNPAPVGVSGELCVGGAGVSRGYLARPSETAERFVPDPRAADGDRMYRTGDRVRRLPSGAFEFRGRVDHQVKIRGYRVEPAEIEAVLAEHPAVSASVVSAVETAPGDPRLVAWYVSSGGDAVDAEALSEHLAGLLPDYMVPSSLVALPSLPLTPNGKIDRSALPEPGPALGSASRTEPSTETERRLAEIWTELLKRDDPGAESDFFDLGGHSLSAMQLISRIRQTFEVELPLLAIFEDSTLSGLAARIDDTERTPGTTRAPVIEVVDRSGPVPVSYSQERLWLFEQLQPDTAAYNIPVAVTVDGPLRPACLEQSISEIVRRHEVLRTTFTTVASAPMQVVQPAEARPLPVVDLTGLEAEDREATLEGLANQDAGRCFDLEKGPVWRSALLRLDDGRHALLWNQHHICSDAWSAGVFAQELSSLYRGTGAGDPSPMADPEVQYADYAAWQREWLEAEHGERQLGYWEERLAGAPPESGLPKDRSRPRRQTFAGGMESTELTPRLSAAIAELGRAQGATVFVTLLAAFATLLRLHGAEEDVVIGSPTAGRGRPETESLIGFFLNTLALKVPVPGSVSFAELLAKTRADVLEAFANQDLPFERVVEALNVERDPSRSPLYQVMFNHQKAADAGAPFPGLEIGRVGVADAASKFDLTLYSHEGPERTSLRLAYNRAMFDAATARAMLDRLVVLLEAVVTDPDRKIRELPLVPDHQGRNGRVDSPLAATATSDWASDSETIHGRFAAVARKHPDAVALRTETREWSYARLAEESAGLAARIGAALDTAPARVGLLFDTDPPLFAALLGTLRAGCAYVPLDPANPRARLAHMLEDSRASLILTDATNAPLARELGGDLIPVVDVEAGPHPEAAATVSVTSEDVAYVLYTSGSSGLPKGVVQSHRNALHFARVYATNLALSPRDRLSLLSSYGFDGAVMDILGALLNGASLHPMDLRTGFVDVLDRLESEGVTVYHSTPTVYRQLMAHVENRHVLADVRAVVLGGEEALSTDLDLFKERFTEGAVFVNGLGPSESTVTLQHFMDHTTPVSRSSLPVGWPVAETDVLLLGEDGWPTDVFGEIAIASDHVALEYWGAPDVTAAAFAPVRGREGRVYRTGDLGRRLPDGSLEFVGRKDDQVKIRGIRIEPGEIEAALTLVEGVLQAAVVARDGASGEKELVAYVVPAAAAALSPADLRTLLGARVPRYMIPSAFVTVGSIPLTATGKLDVGRLPDPPNEPEYSDDEFEPPETPAELAIAAIWREVLETEEVSVHDRFFDLGGQSLQAVVVITRLKSEHGYEVPFADLTYQTLAQIAAALG